MSFNLTIGDDQTYPPRATVADAISAVEEKLNYICETDILSGFEYEHGGETYKFSYQVSDQANFTAMGSKALLSMQISGYTDEQLIAQFGTADESQLPVAKADKWVTGWRGHNDSGSHTLSMTLADFIGLYEKSGSHNESTLATCWAAKADLEKCTTEAEVNAWKKAYDLDTKYRAATELRETL